MYDQGARVRSCAVFTSWLPLQLKKSSDAHSTSFIRFSSLYFGGFFGMDSDLPCGGLTPHGPSLQAILLTASGLTSTTKLGHWPEWIKHLKAQYNVLTPPTVIDFNVLDLAGIDSSINATKSSILCRHGTSMSSCVWRVCCRFSWLIVGYSRPMSLVPAFSI